MTTATIEDVLNKYSYMDTLDKKILRNSDGYGKTGIFDIAPALLVVKQWVVFIREDKEKNKRNDCRQS